MFEWLLPFSYLLASVLFILSIRGLASPKTAREGNLLGMLGMTIAIIITLYSPLVSDIALTIGVIILGAMVGVYFALKVKMTSLPQMIAAFNGLGGLSAVFISLAEILAGSEARTEASLGLIIGAVAFSGSMIAFAKLQGLMPAKAIVFPRQQLLNLFLAIAVIAVCVIFVINGDTEMFYWLTGLAHRIGVPPHHSHRRRRYAGRHFRLELLFRLGCRRNWLLPQQCAADYCRGNRRRQRSHFVIHYG